MAKVVEILDVNLPDHPYKIYIGVDLLDDIANFLEPHLIRKKIVVITEITVSNLYLDQLKASFDNALIKHDVLILPAGEGSKCWKTLSKTVEWLIEKRVERDDLILAFGGGVIGDLAGFAASILRRGVAVMQVPTTLLAQVDSSVGGKTGINSVQGKNLIGTFHQPISVIADTSLLKSLTRRDFLSGYAEVVKYGLLGDFEFFEWLEKNSQNLVVANSQSVNYAVRQACFNKAKIVISDEKEKGLRAVLNLGHTFGHALEASTNYSDKLLHGEGVAIGCILAFKYSRELGFCSDNDVERVFNHFEEVGLKTGFKDVPGDLPTAEQFIGLMMNDKKVKNELLKLVLVNSIGSAFVFHNLSLSHLHSFLIKEMR